MSGVVVNDPGNTGSNPARVLQKNSKNGNYAALLNTQRYKVRIKD